MTVVHEQCEIFLPSDSVISLSITHNKTKYNLLLCTISNLNNAGRPLKRLLEHIPPAP